MAEFLQKSFGEIATAALLPSLLYYLAIFLMVDLEAIRLNLKGLTKDHIPALSKVFKRIYLLLPIAVLVYMLLIARASITRSGITAIVICVVVSWFNKETRMGLQKLCNALYRGAMGSIGIAGICAAAGIIVGAVGMTGLGPRFSSLVLQLAHGNITIIAVLTAVICLVLGMGLPTTAAYIISVTVAAPALINGGIDPLAAHMFVFYYAILSAITPPVAAASYAAASIADAPIMKTGFTALRLGLTAYIIPFFFLNNQALLMVGDLLTILRASVTAVFAIFLFAMVIENVTYLRKPLHILTRLIYLGAFFMLLDPNVITDLIGLALVVVGFLLGIALKPVPDSGAEK